MVYSFRQKLQKKNAKLISKVVVSFWPKRKILPPLVRRGFNHFKNQVNLVNPVNPPFLTFSIIFKTSWILCWEFKTSQMENIQFSPGHSESNGGCLLNKA